jgi:predicted nucleotidyltransferase
MTQINHNQRPTTEPTATLLDEYVAYWKKHQAAQQADNRHLQQQALLDAHAIAAMLRREFGVSRVVLFGSVAKGHVHRGSDIDLAVANLKKEALFAAMAQATCLSQFTVDLKPLEELESHFQERVLATGVDI